MPPPPPHRASPSNLRGILAMLLAMAAFVTGDTFMKMIATTVPTGEAISIRAVFCVVLALGIAAFNGTLGRLKRMMVPVVGLRCLAEIGSSSFYQHALARMPFADINAILQLTPLAITAGSALAFGERVGWRRWSAILIGFCGVLLIIRPGSSSFSWWAILALGGVMCGTLRDLCSRRIDHGTPPILIMLLSQLAVMAGGLMFLPFESWHLVSVPTLLKLALAAAFSLLGQVSVIIAMRAHDVAIVAPFRYTNMAWAILYGMLIWGQFPDKLTLIGMAIVVAAGLYTFHREQVRRREAVGSGQ